MLVKMPDGTQVGRVPNEISAVLSPAMRNGRVVAVKAIFLGRMQHDGPYVGGGPKLEARYFFESRDAVVQSDIGDIFLMQRYNTLLNGLDLL